MNTWHAPSVKNGVFVKYLWSVYVWFHFNWRKRKQCKYNVVVWKATLVQGQPIDPELKQVTSLFYECSVSYQSKGANCIVIGSCLFHSRFLKFQLSC